MSSAKTMIFHNVQANVSGGENVLEYEVYEL